MVATGTLLVRNRSQVDKPTLFTDSSPFAELRDARRLTADWPEHMRSPNEEIFRDALVRAGVPTFFEIREYSIGRGEGLSQRGWKPDFTTELLIGGRQAVIEDHTNLTPDYISKIGVVRAEHPELYTILASGMPYRKVFEPFGDDFGVHKAFVDEYWWVHRAFGAANFERAKKQTEKRVMSLVRRSDNAEELGLVHHEERALISLLRTKAAV